RSPMISDVLMEVLMDVPHLGDKARFGLGLSLVFALVGCSTKAVGINECRDVESARCEASVPCGVIDESEVEECKRFYDDHCLHGITGKETPSADEHRACLELIEDAGQAAAAALGMGGAFEADDASCEIVSAPWKQPECAYLVGEESSMGGGEP